MFMFGSVNFYENSRKKLNNKTKCTALTGLCCILAQSLDISSNFWKRRRKKYFSWHWFCGDWINRKIRRKKLLPFLFSVDCSRLESQCCVFNLKYLHSYFQTEKMKIVINWKFYDADRICNKTKWRKWNHMFVYSCEFVL